MWKESPLRSELLARLQAIGVVRRERVELTSGQHTDYYIDIKQALGDPQALLLMTQALSLRIRQKATAIAGGGYGGASLATAVSMKTEMPLVLVRPAERTHGLQKQIEGYIPDSDDSIAVVEDVVTTGESCRNVANAVRSCGANVAGWYSVVWRGDDAVPSELTSLFSAQELLA